MHAARRVVGLAAWWLCTKTKSHHPGGLRFDENVLKNGKRNEKGASRGERPSAIFIYFLFMVVVVIGAFVVSVHVIFHVFHHGVEFRLLLVGQNVTHFGMDGVMHALHLGVLVIHGQRFVVHHGLHLLVIFFQDGLDLGLLVRGKVQPGSKFFDVVVNIAHAGPLAHMAVPALLLISAWLRRRILLSKGRHSKQAGRK